MRDITSILNEITKESFLLFFIINNKPLKFKNRLKEFQL